jgi:hypothetical protein
MRTTVTLDPDVEALLRKAVRDSGEPFKQVLNRAVRDGLTAGRRGPAKPFKQPTFRMGKPLVDLTKALALSADVEDATTVTRSGRRARRS